MEAFYTAIRRHRRLNFTLTYCFSILIVCCTFPILLLTGEWPACNFTWHNAALYLLVSLFCPSALCLWAAARRPDHTK